MTLFENTTVSSNVPRGKTEALVLTQRRTLVAAPGASVPLAGETVSQDELLRAVQEIVVSEMLVSG